MKVLVTRSEARSTSAMTKSHDVSFSRAGLCDPLGTANWSSRDLSCHKVLWVPWEWFSQTRTQEPRPQHCNLWAPRGYIRDVPETFLKTLVSLCCSRSLLWPRHKPSGIGARLYRQQSKFLCPILHFSQLLKVGVKGAALLCVHNPIPPVRKARPSPASL